MNLILFDGEELAEGDILELRDRRLQHLLTVLKSTVGDHLRVGEINGLRGTAEVLAIDEHCARLKIHLEQAPPAALDLVTVLALPRPKMLRRMLRTLAEIGVKDIHLINSYRVEKSFWQSPLLDPRGLDEALRSGLEQGMDTIMPRLSLHPRFRPFAEDLLPEICEARDALLGDPLADTPYPAQPTAPALLIIGPEGGFIPFERDLLIAAGARGVSLGPRILRTETALITALGRHLGAAQGGPGNNPDP